MKRRWKWTAYSISGDRIWKGSTVGTIDEVTIMYEYCSKNIRMYFWVNDDVA